MPTEVAMALADCKAQVEDINSHRQQYVQICKRKPVPEILTLPGLVERAQELTAHSFLHREERERKQSSRMVPEEERDKFPLR